MPTATEYANQITVVQHFLLRSGLTIFYELNKEEKVIELEPQETAELLKSAGFILNWKNYDGQLLVRVEVEPAPMLNTERWMEYEDYAMFNEPSQSEAIWLCAHYEKEQADKPHIDAIKGMIGMVDNILNPAV